MVIRKKFYKLMVVLSGIEYSEEALEQSIKGDRLGLTTKTIFLEYFFVNGYKSDK